MTPFPTHRWVLYNCLGGLLGILLGAVALPLTMLLGFGGGIGLGVALLQVRLLGAHAGGEKLFNSVGWVLVSTIAGVLPGWLLAFALIMGGSNGGAPVTDPMGYIGGVSGAVALFAGVGAAVCGGLAGIAHGFMLRRGQGGVAGAFGWGALTGVGWGLSWAAQGGGLGLLVTGGRAGGVLGPILIALGALLVLAGWAPYALVTAPLLAARGQAPEAPAGPGYASPSP